MKYLNFNYVYDIIKQDKTCQIEAGTKTDWYYTSATLYKNQKFHEGCFTYSKWDLPQIIVKHSDGKKEILNEYTTEPEYPIEVYEGSNIKELEKNLKKYLSK